MKTTIKLFHAFAVFILLASLASCNNDDPDPVTKNSSKAISSFSLGSLNLSVAAVIDESAKTIKADLPSGTDLTKLAPTVTVSDKATVSPASGVVQDFTKPVVYTVTSEDGASQAYTVTLKIIDNGTVYIGNLDGNFYALDALTGTKKWEFKTGGAVQSTPTVMDGVVYFASWDKKIYALDAATGTQKWESAPGLLQPFAAPAIEKGLLYYGGEHYLFALDVATGVVKWKFQDDEVYGWEASPTVVDGIVYASIRGGGSKVGIYGLDALTGALKWKAAKTHITESSPAIANNLLYAGSEYEGFNAFDIKTGATKWEYPDASVVNSSPTISNGTVYFGSGLFGTGTNKILALNALTGAKKWEYATDEGTVYYSSPLVADGLVYIGGKSKLYALDATSGAKKWIVEPEQNTLIYSGPVIANTLVYIGIGKKVYAFDALNGTKKWEYETSRTIDLSSPCVTDKNGKVFHAGISGMVQ
ncbi:PQQ-binding-like beta-propeller repeat protein [Dyadobacter sp. 3J3]|uniref:outer membrane protein assembly factor BamB family protein n=1 Tax=Dyadobacter sp. 3J3 TaxID=2606600 RepID=UPI00135BCD47|nr:PQQ-binding-like beta-propeller repeat protein [Dyadobacter sp. 3J3]